MARRFLIVLAGISALAGGCVDMGEVRQFRDRTERLREAYSADTGAWERRVAGMAADDPRRADAQAALARARARQAAAEAAVRQVDTVISGAEHPDDTLGQTVQAVSPWLPAPVRLPLALAAALGASLIRGNQLKRGMISIAHGLNKAMDEDPEFRAGFKRHANTFRAIQTPAASRAVDQAARRRPTRMAA
jgi:hypothetical protein